jgi:AcrR family transcriptional regulator
MIVQAAAELFSRHGFHATGIDDIGAAVGITGPGVYRHFESKHDLLAAIVEHSLERHEAIVEEVQGSKLTPTDALRRLVQATAEEMASNREVSAIFFHESRSLAPDAHARFTRIQRGLIKHWVELLKGARPELTDEQARVVVRASSGLLNSVGQFSTTMPADQLAPLLAEMALASLLTDKIQT